MPEGETTTASEVAAPARPAEGGYGWAVVAAAFTANAVGFGILYSFGVFFPAMLDEFGLGRGATSGIISIAAAVMLGVGGVTGRLADRFGARLVVAAGAVLISSGLALSSLARSIWQVYLAYGLLLGLGVSCAFLPSVSAVSRWFVRRRGLATGIAVAGTGVGTILVAPISERLIAAAGWRGAARTLAVAGLLLLLVAAALVRGPAGGHKSSILAAMRRDRVFRILYLDALIASYGFWVPFVHIVPFALDRGLTTAAAAFLVAAMGGANTAGRVLLGGLADRVGRLRIFQLSTLAMAVATLLWPLASGRVGLTAFAVAYGFLAGAFISLFPALIGDYFGVERLAGISGLLYTGAALGSLLGAPATGALFDALGTYTPAILIAGGSMAVGAAVLLGLPDPRAERIL